MAALVFSKRSKMNNNKKIPPRGKCAYLELHFLKKNHEGNGKKTLHYQNIQEL